VIFYRWCTSFDCWEQFVPLLFSFKHAHMYIYIYIRTTYKLPTIEMTYLLLWESNFSFSSSNMFRKLKKRREGKNGWTASLIEVTVDVSVLQLENSSCILLILFFLLFLVVNWRRVTVRHTITRKLQRPVSHEEQRHKINEMECVCVVFFLLQ